MSYPFTDRPGMETIRTILAAMILTCLVTSSSAVADNRPFQTVRIAGTFNNWNTADDTCRMTKVGDRYEIVRFWGCDTYHFKFVFDASWDHHLGDAGGGRLTQPGENIDLKIPQSGEFAIWLDVKKDQWGLEPRPPQAPHAVIRVHDASGGTATLDAGTSLAREDHPLSQFAWDVVRKDKAFSTKARPVAGGPEVAKSRFSVPTPGDYTITLNVSDGDMSDTASMTLRLDPGWTLAITADEDGEATPRPTLAMLPLRDHLWATPLPTGREQPVKLSVQGNLPQADVANKGRGETYTHNATLTPGRQMAVFNAETGAITLSDEDWHEFIYEPAKDAGLPKDLPIDRVELVGDFNGWRPGECRLHDTEEGRVFRRIAELPDGVHHYQFLVNGVYWREDPNADPKLRKPGDYGTFQSGVLIGADASQFGKPKPDAIALGAVKHNPRKTRYLTPVASNLAYLVLRTLADDAETVSLYIEGEPKSIPMQKFESRDGFDYWQTQVLTHKAPFRYSFRLSDGTARAYLNQQGAVTTNHDPQYAFNTELSPAFETPEWAKRAVWYQIFPERFRNGTPDNDPPRTVPWTHEWFKPYSVSDSPDPARNFEETGTFYRYFIFDRRYGGDIQGVREKLPYLRELGITAIYFNPVFIAESLHKYDATDYRHIDDFFGVKGSLAKIIGETTDPATWQWSESDLVFLDFIKEAHRLGFKVIIDGVFNHTGRDFWAFQDILKNGKDSPYAGWFEIDNWEPLEYQAWDSPNGCLPKLKHNEALGLAKPVRDHLFAVTRRWMDPNGDGDPSDGIDGWRLDVASDVNANFWRPWREVVKGCNPDAYIVAELWEESRDWLKGDTFDAVMHYPFARSAQKFFVNQRKRIEPSQFQQELVDALSWYQPQVNYVLQMLYDSHDTDRVASMFMNPDLRYDGSNRVQDNGPNYNVSKPTPECYQRLKPMVTMQMTWLGAPMVYYGDEVGMYGADDPNCRKPMIWADLLPYEDPQERIEQDVFDHYRHMIAVRNTFPSLQLGLVEPLVADDKADVFAFSRTLDNETIIVVINNGNSPYQLDVPAPWPTSAKIVRLDDPKACKIIPPTAREPKARPILKPVEGHIPLAKVVKGKLRGITLPPWSAAVFGVAD